MEQDTSSYCGKREYLTINFLCRNITSLPVPNCLGLLLRNDFASRIILARGCIVMPEYYSDRSHHSSGFSEINIYRNPNSRVAKYRRAKYGVPELTEEEEHQQLLDKFGERVAARAAEKEANALVEQDYQVEDKQSVREKETEEKTEHSH